MFHSYPEQLTPNSLEYHKSISEHQNFFNFVWVEIDIDEKKKKDIILSYLWKRKLLVRILILY